MSSHQHPVCLQPRTSKSRRRTWPARCRRSRRRPRRRRRATTTSRRSAPSARAPPPPPPPRPPTTSSCPPRPRSPPSSTNAPRLFRERKKITHLDGCLLHFCLQPCSPNNLISFVHSKHFVNELYRCGVGRGKAFAYFDLGTSA